VEGEGVEEGIGVAIAIERTCFSFSRRLFRWLEVEKCYLALCNRLSIFHTASTAPQTFHPPHNHLSQTPTLFSPFSPDSPPPAPTLPTAPKHPLISCFLLALRH
jgi:hypothetical protein